MTSQQNIIDITGVEPMSDEQEFIFLMQQNQERIYRLAFHLLGNREEARDATQETFIKAWKKLKTLRRETSHAWLSKVAVNLCLDWLRRRKFRGEMPGEKDESQNNFEYHIPDLSPDPLELSLSAEMEAEVRTAIMKLAPKYRAVIILRDLEGYSYQEISEMLKMKLSKVKSSLFRGRQELKESLRPFFEVSG